MREFHEEQIKALRTIYKSLENDVCLTLTLSRFGYPDLAIVKREKIFSLIYSDPNRLRNFYYLIYTLMLLKNDGDVLFIDNDVTPIDQLENAHLTTTGQYKESIIKDEEIITFLSKNWNKTIIFSFALIDYIIKGETSEQIRFKENQKAAWTGIKTAIFIGIIGILFNIITLCNSTKFNKTQLYQIEQTIIKQKKPEKINTKMRYMFKHTTKEVIGF